MLAIRYSHGQPMRLHISDLVNTLISGEINPDTGKFQPYPETKEQRQLIEKLIERLGAGGILVIETGDRFYDAKMWLIDRLPEDVREDVIVLSQTGMLGHRYDPNKNTYVLFMNAAEDLLNEQQRQQWGLYKNQIIGIALKAADAFLGEKNPSFIDKDAETTVTNYAKGSVAIRTHQLAISVQRKELYIEINEVEAINAEIRRLGFANRLQIQNGDNRREKIFTLIELLKAGFAEISIMRASELYIDMLFILGFNKGRGLESLAQNKWFIQLLKNNGISWREAFFTGDSLRGNDRHAAEFVIKQGGIAGSVGQSDYDHPEDLPQGVVYEKGFKGEAGMIRFLTS